jgi:rhamnogalacturonan endolyase
MFYGSMAVDDNGKGLWSARLFHGDAMHVGDLDPTHPGLEKFGVHEEMRATAGSARPCSTPRPARCCGARPPTRTPAAASPIDIDPRFPATRPGHRTRAKLYT